MITRIISKSLAIVVILVMVVGMFPQELFACHEPPELNPECLYAETNSMGYWKNHSENYVLPQNLSCETVSTSQQAIEIFENANADEMVDMLKAQLLAMKFNVSHFEIGQYVALGHNITLNEVISQAQDLLCGDSSREEMGSMKNLLDLLNNHHIVEYCPEPPFEILGCMDPEANNYNSEATQDDGSCQYDILGCMDVEALNYNSEATIDDGSCEYPEPDPLIIKAYKVVCDNEEDLPNWTNGGAPSLINENTALDYVSQSREACHLESNWDFQWGYSNVIKLSGDYVGPAPVGVELDEWKDFDSSTQDLSTPAMITIDELAETSRIWVREVLKEGYIPFTNPPKGVAEDNVSAEIYCHNDILNYDNYDYIISPELEQTYYCVAFNVLKENEVSGCTDSEALNYNPEATIDDGSCEYLPVEIPGCMDVEALNYNSEATEDDGSCEYDISGCTNPEALNYNPEATIDDGSCQYPPSEIPGCMDSEANNYNSNATIDDGSCEYPPVEIPGCTDPGSLNYNSNATLDDGSCTYGGGSSGKPSLRMNKSVEEEFTNPGGIINFVIEIENTASGVAYKAMLEDVLPEGFFYNDTDSSNKKWQLGDISGFSKRTITYQVEVGLDIEAGFYTNTAELSALNNKTISDTAEIDVRQPIVLGEETPDPEPEPEPEPERDVLPHTGVDSFLIYLLLGFAVLINGLLGLASLFTKKHKQKIQIVLFVSLIVGALTALSYPFWPLISYEIGELKPVEPVLAEENSFFPLLDSGLEKEGNGIEQGIRETKTKSNYLVVSKIGVEIPIITGNNESALDRGAWLLPESSTPDIIGNTILAGHRYKYRPPHKETFYLLDKISEGDLIQIFWQGKEYRYKVISSQVVDPEAVEVLRQTSTATITLITCHPLFSDKKRLVVKGELI